MIERFNARPRLAKAVKHGELVFLSGEVANDPALTTVEAQTATVLAKIDAQLAECGSDRTRILYAQIWLADMSAFAEMNAVWDAWIDKERPPARATVGAALAKPHNLVEIQVVAVAGS